ncbi:MULTISPECIES: sugar ABC transporter ATP-binding protein [Pseudothermotoga]|jgi:ribose transport system ATP-binding protein|uniref:ABC transporter related n=1 Tax=Pseudothermotoga lettingae (strain ATCC BAA-301 / DSM 14385 / NBRC 107922 / TMO) TaxID=416591 RepID=A8F6V0_PSELT|nr:MULTISPECIES: sugar ABC transporter ATP-binding protein [Pseudothermotoga]ABV33884.1 ABC transporter related [Pseudothermotoga lettingae TMO]MDK2884285.1 ribose transport system ATP-binding protein [Pseudothermotoga sp.]GLI49179.1 ribose import ATP-binding protein RbsA 2 [Pseudothermotoga lettingae TMO]
MNDNVILRTENVTKTFPGVVAVDDVSLSIEKGIVTAVIGENGAGKSTLMKIFSGVYSDYVGKIFFNGKEMRFRNPREAIDAGIFLIPQELDLVPNLTIAENMWLGREPLNLWGFMDYKYLFNKSKEILKKVRLSVDPKKKVEELSTGQQQLVAIAKSLVSKAKVIIMDEPTSAISEKEIENLFEIIRNLRDQGTSIIYISHKLDEVFSISQKIIVMRDGKVVASGDTNQFTYDDIVKYMVGRSIDKFYIREKSKIGEEILRVENLSVINQSKNKKIVDNISLNVHKGEILGIYGLIGAGRSEVMEAIFGFHQQSLIDGKIYIDGQLTKIRKTIDAIRAGIGYVPEDRKLSGLILKMSVLHNISLPGLKYVSKFGFVNRTAEKDTAREYVIKLNIKTPSINQIVENLSGGNQQKVVLAKWLSLKPKVILLDEPTRGIDVNAKAEIYSLISDLAKAGVGVILVSSELPEVLAMSDRIVVMSEGKKTAEFMKQEATEEKLLKAAIPKSFKIGKV